MLEAVTAVLEDDRSIERALPILRLSRGVNHALRDMRALCTEETPAPGISAEPARCNSEWSLRRCAAAACPSGNVSVSPVYLLTKRDRSSPQQVHLDLGARGP